MSAVAEAARPESPSSDHPLRETLYRQLMAAMPENASQLPRDQLRAQLADQIELLSAQLELNLTDEEQAALIHRALEDFSEYGPLTGLMRDAEISDILVNGPFQVFVERQGLLEPTKVTFGGAQQLEHLMRQLAEHAGRKLDDDHRMVDARLPDGSRMNAILNPPAINGPLLSIRRFGGRPLTADDLLRLESLTSEMLEFLAAAVRGRLNIVISGGAGSGKTTLLNALSRYIRPTERIATIEDTAELDLQQPHIIKLEASADHGGRQKISMRELVKNTLRVRPDRIIVGECRGAEALDMLQAMNTGHIGSMTTIHANSPREVFSRIELMTHSDNVDIPIWTLRKYMATTINLVVQMARQVGGKRKVVCVSEVTGMEENIISMHDLFQFVPTGVDNGATAGNFQATGIRPLCLDRLAASGTVIADPHFFERRTLRTTSRLAAVL